MNAESKIKPATGAPNLDAGTVSGFGDEWVAFDQTGLQPEEKQRQFANYFNVFPWSALPPGAEGFDLGCGSGRWALLAAPRVGHLHCIDASDRALQVARRRLAGTDNVSFHHASVDAIPLADGSQDFGYSLGVLHHVPGTAAGLADCVRKLKPGAPFLVYLYYRFDDRPAWFRMLWHMSDRLRRIVSSLPFALRRPITDTIALTVYWPLSRAAGAAERWGFSVRNWPLALYRHHSIYTLRTDALDRFATRLEKRFTREEIQTLMVTAGLEHVHFSETEPFWTAVGYRGAE